MVKCRDITNSAGYGICDKDVKQVGTSGRNNIRVECSDGHQAIISINDWNAMVQRGRWVPAGTLADNIRQRINRLLDDNVPDQDILTETVVYVENHFVNNPPPAGNPPSRKQITEGIKRLLDSAKREKGKTETKKSDILCPECRTKKMEILRDNENNMDFYYCTNANCRAYLTKLSPRQVKEKQRVYWGNRKDGIERNRKTEVEQRKAQLRAGNLTQGQYQNNVDMINRLHTQQLQNIEQQEENDTPPQLYYFRRRDDYKRKKTQYKGQLVRARNKRRDLIDDLKRELAAGTIDKKGYSFRKKRIDEKYGNLRDKLRNKISEAKDDRNVGFDNWSKRAIGGEWGTHITKIIGLLAMILAGMTISYFFEGSWAGNFTLGFILLAISAMMPSYQAVEGFDKISMNIKPKDFIAFKKMARHLKDNRHTGSSAVKSAFKFFAVWFFITGARNATAIGFLANIVMIVVAALAYFSFSSKYDPNVPGQVFESFARFFIGIIVIPWWVFYGIFQSFVLGLMATAFFAVPPVASKESGEGEKTLMGEYTRWLFFAIMAFALIGSGMFGESFMGMPTWGLTGALRSTFFYFWIVTGIAGFFSPASQRPALGFIMLSAATMIYAVGPGTQEVGSALLGPWFGKTFAGLTEIMAPVTQAFDQIGSTMGNAFQMLVNPVGFATGIMSGTYALDQDTGLVGSFGVEVNSFRVTPIYTNQPYSIIISMQNKGSAEAESLRLMLVAGTGVGISSEGGVVATGKNLPKTDTKFWRPFDSELGNSFMQVTDGAAAIVNTIKKKALNLEKLGLNQADLDELSKNSDISYDCNDDYTICTADIDRTMPKLSTEQIFFNSNGIPCSSVVEYGLLTEKGSRFLPFTAIVQYDYSIESTLQIEAISADEWNRLAQEGLLYPGQKKPSTMANSPAMLNLDTLEQPIREGTPFFIALNLTPAIPGKGWIEDAKVTLEIPEQLSRSLTKCTTPTSSTPASKPGSEDIIIYEWDGNYPTNRNAIYCYFGSLILEEDDKPTQTFFIKAYSDYTFNDANTKAFALEFGGTICCESNEDCPGQKPVCGATETNVCGAGDGTDTCTPAGNRCENPSDGCPNGWNPTSDYMCPDQKICCTLDAIPANPSPPATPVNENEDIPSS